MLLQAAEVFGTLQVCVCCVRWQQHVAASHWYKVCCTACLRSRLQLASSHIYSWCEHALYSSRPAEADVANSRLHRYGDLQHFWSLFAHFCISCKLFDQLSPAPRKIFLRQRLREGRAGLLRCVSQISGLSHPKPSRFIAKVHCSISLTPSASTCACKGSNMWPLFRRWLSPPMLFILIWLLSSAVAQSPGGTSPSRTRRLLAASGLPSRLAPPAVVSLDDLLAGIDLSGGPKSVEVHIKPGDSQRAAVVVSSCC